ECQFDGGPTLLMMLDPFRKLFADVGEEFEKHVPIELCEPCYRVFFSNGDQVEATTDIVEMQRRIAALGAVKDAEKYPAFMAELKQLYDESIPNFVRKNYGSLGDFASPPQLKRVLKNHMLSNLAKRVEARFEDPRVRMLFTFQTMYLGLSPFDAPWVYATLAYMEYGEGIWYPKRGLPAITEAIAALAQTKGAEIRLNTSVTRIEGRTLVLNTSERMSFDAIICNADMPYAQQELADEKPRKGLRYSCSAHLMYLDYKGDLEGLRHHNVIFGADFKGNLDDLFHHHKFPNDPAFYVCISKRSDESVAPEGHLNLFILVPIPNLDADHSPENIEKLERAVFDRLKRETNFDPSNIVNQKRRSAKEWESELNLERGAAFGISHDLFQSAFMRPQNVSKSNPNLFYVGASTVPGNGLPMVLISAELIEQRLISGGVISP
ncbi:MAG TPA: phytoene desaturase family protein, partial [Fimbriimonas sp.]|nr:phytoene desaturase family protein [Fimbriimonas sp.]